MEKADSSTLRQLVNCCDQIRKILAEYGESFELFEKDPIFQRYLLFYTCGLAVTPNFFSQQFLDETSDYAPWNKCIKNLDDIDAGLNELIYDLGFVDKPYDKIKRSSSDEGESHDEDDLSYDVLETPFDENDDINLKNIWDFVMNEVPKIEDFCKSMLETKH
jgi:hypothetical protein